MNNCYGQYSVFSRYVSMNRQALLLIFLLVLDEFIQSRHQEAVTITIKYSFFLWSILEHVLQIANSLSKSNQGSLTSFYSGREAPSWTEVSAPFFLVVFSSGRTCSAHALCECWAHVPKGLIGKYYGLHWRSDSLTNEEQVKFSMSFACFISTRVPSLYTIYIHIVAFKVTIV